MAKCFEEYLVVKYPDDIWKFSILFAFIFLEEIYQSKYSFISMNAFVIKLL